MQVYADYAFYKDQYLGSSLTEEQFPALALRASAYLDRVTFSRAAHAKIEHKEQLALACCAIAEECDRIERDKLSSETVGEWSRAYRNDERSRERRIYGAAALYLAGTGLLYRGIFDV